MGAGGVGSVTIELQFGKQRNAAVMQECYVRFDEGRHPNTLCLSN